MEGIDWVAVVYNSIIAMIANNFAFLEKYERLQSGIMFDKRIDLGFATVSYCKTDNSPFWNHALVNKLVTADQLGKIELSLRSLQRKPALYFETRREFNPLINFLTASGYKKSFEDSWMFHNETIMGISKFDGVKKVNDEKELKIFLEIFNACYQKNDPQNPYGELGDYLKVAKTAWRKHHAGGRIEYFTVYKGRKPVAVSTLTNYEGIGYISNVGSLREVRGEGYGKTATLFCVEQSKKHGNKSHCLATEEGTYPNEFYKRIGFETRFTAAGYIENTR